MIFGRSPDGGRWHIITGGLANCHRGRSGGQTTGWVITRRLPPSRDGHCCLCFPWHTPPTMPVTVHPGWDLDRFLDSL